jgi:molecular chaperone GrpE
MSEKSRSAQRPTEDSSAERVVIRDKRKIDPNSGRGRHARPAPDEGDEAVAADAGASGEGSGPPAADAAGGGSEENAQDSGTPDQGTPDQGTRERGGSAPAGGGLGAELEALRAELDERTRDLQRVTAEYANYRKRVDRDRGLAAEQTTGNVLGALLPILDDLDRAREHGDLVGPFASVAEQFNAALSKFGLTAFGDKGDPFDPTRHEAVAHLTSADVSEPTCVDVMRRGYLVGERLLRPAMVAVADPE